MPCDNVFCYRFSKNIIAFRSPPLIPSLIFLLPFAVWAPSPKRNDKILCINNIQCFLNIYISVRSFLLFFVRLPRYTLTHLSTIPASTNSNGYFNCHQNKGKTSKRKWKQQQHPKNVIKSDVESSNRIYAYLFADVIAILLHFIIERLNNLFFMLFCYSLHHIRWFLLLQFGRKNRLSSFMFVANACACVRFLYELSARHNKK